MVTKEFYKWCCGCIWEWVHDSKREEYGWVQMVNCNSKHSKAIGVVHNHLMPKDYMENKENGVTKIDKTEISILKLQSKLNNGII